MTDLLGQSFCSTSRDGQSTTYELRIGVTGHRHLVAEKVPAIEAEVRGLLDRIEQVLQETSVRPLAYAAINPVDLGQLDAWFGERIDAGLIALLRRIWPAIPPNLETVPVDR